MSGSELAEQSRGADNYRKSLRDAMRGYRTRSIDYDQFWQAMTATIQRRLPQAWYEGAKECGILPADLSPEERMALQQTVVNEMSFISKLAQAIDEDREKHPERKTPSKSLFARLDMWAQRYTDLQSRARLMACEDQKLKWVLGPTKEHCPSCLKVAEKVKRASYWRRVNIYPQRPINPNLECQGFGQCQLLPTDERCSPGPLPRLP
jgi:hypothetical protein